MKSQLQPRLIPSTLCFTLLTLLLVANRAPGQVSGATLSGTAADRSGSVVLQKHILIRNQDTGIETAETANANGFFAAPNLQPNSYEVCGRARCCCAKPDRSVCSRSAASQLQPCDWGCRTEEGRGTERCGDGAIGVLDLEWNDLVIKTTVVELSLNGRLCAIDGLSPRHRCFHNSTAAGREQNCSMRSTVPTLRRPSTTTLSLIKMVTRS